MKKPKPKALDPVHDKDARDYAVEVLNDVVLRRQSLDDRLDRLSRDPVFSQMSTPDRGLTRAIATVSMRWLGLLRRILNARLENGYPPKASDLEIILIAAASQILFLDVPDYAAVDTAISMIRRDRRFERYAGLSNAILRGIGREKENILAECKPIGDIIPLWIGERWTKAYGDETAAAIAAMHAKEPPLDVTAKSPDDALAQTLGGNLLPTGTIRLQDRRSVPELPGFLEGQWWIQDFSAAIPARLLGVLPGERVLDLCAAPGGKTAQLATLQADVVAVDRSAPRMKRLKENLARLQLTANCVVSDGQAYNDGLFTRILLDAPCSATGTIRRHPDVGWNKTLADIASLADLQHRLLDHAWTLLSPGGTLVYATCSLEPEEGEQQIEAFLMRHETARLSPIQPQEVGGMGEILTPQGMLRLHPAHLADIGGCDGFFAARLMKPAG